MFEHEFPWAGMPTKGRRLAAPSELNADDKAWLSDFQQRLLREKPKKPPRGEKPKEPPGKKKPTEQDLMKLPKAIQVINPTKPATMKPVKNDAADMPAKSKLNKFF